MLKAYMLSVNHDDDQGCAIVFAERYKDAINAWNCDLECDFIDRRCRRYPAFDGMENASQYEMIYKQWQEGWWFDTQRSPGDPDEVSDEAFKDWYDFEYGQFN